MTRSSAGDLFGINPKIISELEEHQLNREVWGRTPARRAVFGPQRPSLPPEAVGAALPRGVPIPRLGHEPFEGESMPARPFMWTRPRRRVRQGSRCCVLALADSVRVQPLPHHR